MRRILVSLLLYLAMLIAARHLWPAAILFYQGLAIALASALLHWAWLRWRPMAPAGGEPVKDALLVLALAYGFMFTVPTTADRSYTVRMLLLLSNHPEGVPQAGLQDYFQQQFIRQGGVERRVQEQSASGTVQVQADGSVRLTPRGEQVAAASRLTCLVFVCQAPPP